jgi:hypothetical protein
MTHSVISHKLLFVNLFENLYLKVKGMYSIEIKLLLAYKHFYFSTSRFNKNCVESLKLPISPAYHLMKLNIESSSMHIISH